MKVKRSLLFLVFLPLLLLSCRPTHEVRVGWNLFSKTEFAKLEKAELTYGRKLRARNLYVPFFKVDYHKNLGRPIPLNSQVIDFQGDSSMRLVPVVWFSNRVFMFSDSTQLANLSSKIAERVVQLSDSARLGELVFDCDWMPGTAKAYFDLIKGVRSELPYGLKKMTATMPLHYLRYADTVGKPPVDKVIMKMISQSSLLELNEDADPIQEDLLRPYLMDLNTYGAEVEVGVPLGNWGILIRDNKPLRRFFSINDAEIEAQGEFSRVKNLIKVTEDAYFQGEYLSRGDFIRIETYRSGSIRSLFHLVQEFTNKDSMTICLWNLEASFEEKYPTDLLKRWFETRE